MTVSAVVLVVCAALAVAAVWTRMGDANRFAPVGASTTYGMTLEAADPEFTLVSVQIEQPGNEVEVLEVLPLASSNVELLGVFTIWPRDARKNRAGVRPGFAADDLNGRHRIDVVVPATETGFAAEDGSPLPLRVGVGFRVRSGDVGVLDGIRVVYRSGSRTVREYFDINVFACVKPRSCKPPAGVTTAAFEQNILRELGVDPRSPDGRP